MSATSKSTSDPYQFHRDAFSKSQFQTSQMVRIAIEKAQAQTQQRQHASDSEEEESEEAKQKFVTRARCLLLNYWELLSSDDGMDDDASRLRATKQLKQLIQIGWAGLAQSSQKQKKAKRKNKKAQSSDDELDVELDAALPRDDIDIRDLNLRHPRTNRTLLMLACRDRRKQGFEQLLSIEAMLQHGANPTIEDNSKCRAVQYYLLGSPVGGLLEDEVTKACSQDLVMLLLGDKAKEFLSKSSCNLLHVASEKLLPSMVQSFVDLGMSAWNKDASGKLPVHVLCETLNQQSSQALVGKLYAIFQLLFQNMYRENPSLEVEWWQTSASSSKPKESHKQSEKKLLHLAAKMGNAESVRTILSVHPSQAVSRVRVQFSDPLAAELDSREQEQWPVHMAFEFPVKSEEMCAILLEAALTQSNEQSRKSSKGDSLLIPLLIESLRRKYDRCIELLLNTEDKTMLRYRTRPLISGDRAQGTVGLLAKCTTSEQFKLLLPRLRQAGAVVREAFTVAAARGWIDCAMDVILDEDVDVNCPLSLHAINEHAIGHHQSAWKPGSNILHADFKPHPDKPKQLQQLTDLLNAVLNHPIAATLDFSIPNASGCTPLLSIARQCKDYPAGPFSTSLDLLLSLPLEPSFLAVLPYGLCQSFVSCHYDSCNLLHVALAIREPYLFQRILQDRRSASLFLPARQSTRMQIVQLVLEQIEKWMSAPRSNKKPRRRGKPSVAVASSSSSSSSLNLLSANELLSLVRDRFLDYEAEICRVLDMHGMYAVVDDIVLQYVFDDERSATCKVQLDELINESRNHLQTALEAELARESNALAWIDE